MQALLVDGYGRSQSPSPGMQREKQSAPEPRHARAATIFAAIYLALVVGAPFVVRYGPSTDDHAMAALATRIEQPRCASASGHTCAERIQAVHDVSAKPADL